jgi:hypothetical protein
MRPRASVWLITRRAGQYQISFGRIGSVGHIYVGLRFEGVSEGLVRSSQTHLDAACSEIDNYAYVHSGIPERACLCVCA